MQNGSRAPIQQKHFSSLQWSRWWAAVSETIWTSASFAHRSFSFVSCVCLSWSCVWQAVWKCDAGFIIRYTGNTLTHITCTVSVNAFLNPNSSLQAIRYASGYFNWQVKHFFYFNLCWHIEGLYSTFHSNFLLQQISQPSLELTLEPTPRPRFPFILDFRVVTDIFQIPGDILPSTEWKRHTNTADVELGTQLALSLSSLLTVRHIPYPSGGNFNLFQT